MYKDDNIISVDHATVRFNIASEKVDNLKEYFIKLVKHQLYYEEFLALKDISLNIKSGESWGLIGRNGAGKSTLLKLICGILSPYKGNITVHGTIAPLIELGAGLDPRLTAGENIFLNGALLGHSKKYMEEHFNEIVEFAELKNFLDMPIKNYSSGMRARLGFAIATSVSSDILIVDEVLAVGDAAFRKKCEKRMEKMLSNGTTLLFVSHSEHDVERLCEKAVWLEQGEIAMSGSSSEVCFAYADKIRGLSSAPARRTDGNQEHPLNITVVGAGYVGLTSSAVFASMGYPVTCIDKNSEKINMLQRGECPIYEPSLPELLARHASNLQYTTTADTAYRTADAIFITVGTPETADGQANMSYIYNALEDIAKHASHKCMLIVKSTVPVGSNHEIKKFMEGHTSEDKEIHVISNPEFLSQGTAVRDMLKAPRIIIGTDCGEDRAFMENLYKPFNLPIISVSCASAEMIKYACNDFLALKISYINEIANLCEKTGANIKEVAAGMGRDPRIGYSFLNAGIGYGGSCFPKDTKALHRLASSHGYDLQTIQAAINVNEHQKFRLLEKSRKYYSTFSGLSVAFLGVTFKPETDDLRDAPAIENARFLLESGASIKIWDPYGGKKFEALFNGSVSYCDTIESTLTDAELCFIFTEWEQIRKLSPEVFVINMKRPIILDGRNCFVLANMEQHPLIYDSIGRPIINELDKIQG